MKKEYVSVSDLLKASENAPYYAELKSVLDGLRTVQIEQTKYFGLTHDELYDLHRKQRVMYDAVYGDWANENRRYILRDMEADLMQTYGMLTDASGGGTYPVGKNVVKELCRTYPVGCRIALDVMDDPQAPPTGTLGTVLHIDDFGNIYVRWDTGSSLSVVYGKDVCHIVYDEPISVEAVCAALLEYCNNTHYRSYARKNGLWVPDNTPAAMAEAFNNSCNTVRAAIDGFSRFVEGYSLSEKDRETGRLILWELERVFMRLPVVRYARQIINGFMQKYLKLYQADYTDLFAVPMAYTDTEDNHKIQVFLDLIHCRLVMLVGRNVVEVEQYEEMAELCFHAQHYDFDALVSVDEEG